MNNLIQHIGTIKNGKFVSDNPAMLLSDIKKLEGRRVSAAFKAFREFKLRSILQNNYWWGVVCQILSDETGHTPDEIHEILKHEFLAKEYELNGKRFKGAASTASLSTADFEILCSKVRSWASIELGIYIPSPNESPLDIF